MVPLKWIDTLLIFVALVCAVLLFWGGPGAYSSRSFQQAWNLGHLPLFGILTYLALKWPKAFLRRPLKAHDGRGTADRTVSHDRARSGHHSLKIVLQTAHYSGVALDYFPKDWRNHRYIAFSVFNPSDVSLELVCRIHDEGHYRNGGDFKDRFNKTLAVSPGWNDFEISLGDVMNAPRGRKMDMTRVQNFGIFSVQLPHERVI